MATIGERTIERANYQGRNIGTAGSRHGPRQYRPMPSNEYIPALDGLRALSIIFVIIAHFGADHIVPGGFGVTVFFFISGFLISRQLKVELDSTGTIGFRGFYLRRLVRLFPAMATMIALGAALYSLLGGSISSGQALASLLYVVNYWGLLFGFDGGPGVAQIPHPFIILWSLSVEEHFYLLFPLFMLLFGRTRAYIPLLAAVVAASLAWRYAVYDGCHGGVNVSFCGMRPEYRIYKATDTRADSILYGVLLTALLSGGNVARRLAVLAHPATVATAVAVLLATFLYRDERFRETLRYSLQGLALMPLVAAVLFAAPFRLVRVLCELRPAVLIGRYSYSLYLYHWIGMMAAYALTPAAFSGPWLAAAITTTLLLSLASYYGIERPLVALRRRLGSHAVADGGGTR